MTTKQENSTPYLRLDDVHKSFGDKKIVRGMSFGVQRGETYVILGPSGIGKSVTLKMIVGLLRPDQGSVHVGDAAVHEAEGEELYELRSRLGYLFQSGALINWLTVAENVALPMTEHTRMRPQEIDRRVDEYLAMVRMVQAKYQVPGELSGGQRRRVALARVLAGAPSLILYDEPTAGLDPIMATTIAELIRSVQRELGVTSLLVTHDLACAYEAGDRIGMVHEGRIVHEDRVEEFRRADHPIVQNFLRGGRSESKGGIP
jgi:phospholipid/cholesterol/gamma-HCH transport system ATP-binding protein